MRLKKPLDQSKQTMPKTLTAGMFLFLLVILSACGKDRSSTSKVIPQSAADSGQMLSSQTVQISGTANFEHVGKTQKYQYDFYNTTVRPIRWALAEAVSAETGEVFSTTTTDLEGRFELLIPDRQNVIVRIYSRALDDSNPAWHLNVVDNTQQYSTFSLVSPVIEANQTSAPLMLLAKTGWEDGEYSGERQAAPFAIMDTLLDGYLFFAQHGLEHSLAPLSAAWSPNNVAIAGELVEGRIDSTHFSDHRLSPTIYVLGEIHNDADEFDRGILLHEFAHYALEGFTRADTIGGAHDRSSKLDLRVAFNEAMATVVAAIINQSPIFTDVYGARQGLVNRVNIEMDAQDYQGWYSVFALSQLLYDLYDESNENADTVTLGWEGFVQILTHPDFLNFEGASSIYSFLHTAQILFPEEALGIEALAMLRDISVQDPFGKGETNDGGSRVSLPLHNELLLDREERVCSDSDFRDFNGLDVHRLLRFSIPSSGVYTLRAKKTDRGQQFSNPEFTIYQAGEIKLAGLSDTSNIEEIVFSLEAGDYLLDVFDRNNADNDELTGGLACFDVRLTPGEAQTQFRPDYAIVECDSLASYASDPSCEFVRERKRGVEFKPQN